MSMLVVYPPARVHRDLDVRRCSIREPAKVCGRLATGHGSVAAVQDAGPHVGAEGSGTSEGEIDPRPGAPPTTRGEFSSDVVVAQPEAKDLPAGEGSLLSLEEVLEALSRHDTVRHWQSIGLPSATGRDRSADLWTICGHATCQ